MDLNEYRKIRESFGGTGVKFARALRLSTATVYKFDHDLPASAALRVKYAERLRALAEAIATDAGLQAPEVDPMDAANDEALRHYNAITRAATALYRMAKTASVSATRSTSARRAHADATEIAQKQVAITEERKRLRGVLARNQARAEQRPILAALHQSLQAALIRNDAAAYHDILRNPPRRRYALVFVDAFVEVASSRLIAADDPLVTLPDETT